ncbi:hypothetical protein [Piscibacillus halophilus]|uniref:Uncharacterized protein n=2 Tax=Piscibacillus halophilus TaxID=571933 RepID=A0A1H9CK82_9BACI|nr:hypothetical protein [Piscibacillus halophilus]SEQ01008.1 hypothetical protein SAMN05216362_10579 [Piscibacillus halophilus]
MYLLEYSSNHVPSDYRYMIYYPYKITEWSIKYKPFPFMKPKLEKMRLVTNLYKNDTSLFHWPIEKMKPLTTIDSNILRMPKLLSEHDLMDSSEDFLRNLYLHKRKVWSFPELTLLDQYDLFVPYTVTNGERGEYLTELTTGYSTLIQNNQDIYNYLKGAVT